MKHKIKLFAILFSGYIILLTLLFFLVKNTIEFHIFKDVKYLSLYIVLNALVFTVVFGLFSSKYSEKKVKKRVQYIVIIYVVFLILSIGIIALLNSIIFYMFSNGRTNVFSEIFSFTLILTVVSFTILWWVIIIFGIVTFGFTELIYFFMLKKIKTSKKQNPFIYRIVFSVVIGLTITLYWISTITEGAYYKSYSPDGQYSIYASRNKYFNFNFPFVKFGDAGGKVHLYDELENRLITSCSVEMISHVDDHFFWSEDELYMKARIYIKLPRKINAKIIREYDRSYPVKNTWNLFLQGKQYMVIKKGNRLTVNNEKGEVVLENIKHISQINNGFQVLNNTTEIEYYDANLNKLKSAPSVEQIFQGFCGNVTTYGLKIEESEKYFILKKATGFTSYNFSNYKAIDSIKKANVKDIYFLNKKRTLEYNENSSKKESVIIDFGSYFGILSKKYGIAYFDSVDITQRPIKVKRNELYGYYDITSTAYSELKPFEFNLAAFKHEKYGEGYVAINGETYYK